MNFSKVGEISKKIERMLAEKGIPNADESAMRVALGGCRFPVCARIEGGCVVGDGHSMLVWFEGYAYFSFEEWAYYSLKDINPATKKYKKEFDKNVDQWQKMREAVGWKPTPVEL